MKRESLKYIIGVLKGEEGNIRPEWYETLGFLYSHKIAGLFYRRAERQGIPLPDKIKKLLSDTYQRQKRRVERMREQIAEISEKLIQTKTEHLLLKGSVLSNIAEDTIYEDGERISNDIDVLVKPNGITQVEDSLKCLGFVQGKYEEDTGVIVPYSRLEILKRRMNLGETAPFLKTTGDSETPFIEIDINFSLGNIPGEKEGLLSEMITTGKVYRGKVCMRVADEELFFLHLIMHQYKESCLYFMVEKGKDLDLYKLTDIYYLWKAECFDKERLKRLSRKYGVVKEVGTILGQVGRIFSDEEISSAAEEYGDKRPEVVDYESKKRYRWTADEWTRLCRFDAKNLLCEIKENAE